MSTIALGETKRDLLCLLVGRVHNAALCPPPVRQRGTAFRTGLAFRLNIHRPITRPVSVTGSTDSPMTGLGAPGFLCFLLAVGFDGLLRGWRSRSEKPAL